MKICSYCFNIYKDRQTECRPCIMKRGLGKLDNLQYVLRYYSRPYFEPKGNWLEYCSKKSYKIRKRMKSNIRKINLLLKKYDES